MGIRLVVAAVAVGGVVVAVVVVAGAAVAVGGVVVAVVVAGGVEVIVVAGGVVTVALRPSKCHRELTCSWSRLGFCEKMDRPVVGAKPPSHQLFLGLRPSKSDMTIDHG